MEAVWPLTMLAWGPPGLLVYFWFGRGVMRDQGNRDAKRALPMWQATFKGATIAVRAVPSATSSAIGLRSLSGSR